MRFSDGHLSWKWWNERKWAFRNLDLSYPVADTRRSFQRLTSYPLLRKAQRCDSRKFLVERKQRQTLSSCFAAAVTAFFIFKKCAQILNVPQRYLNFKGPKESFILFQLHKTQWFGKIEEGWKVLFCVVCLFWTLPSLCTHHSRNLSTSFK